MKKISSSIKFFIIFSFLAGHCLYFSGVSCAQPSIRFKEIYHDFGEINKECLLTHIFEFENSGNSTLTIKEIRSNCSCVTIKNLSGKKNFQFKEKGQIEVQFWPLYREDEQEMNVSVSSNDPDFPIFKLTVSAKLKIAAVVEPKSLYLYSDENSQDEKKVTLKNKLESDLSVITIEAETMEAERGFIDYRILNADNKLPITIKPGQNLDIMVSLKIKNFEEPLYTNVKFHTDYIYHPDFKVEIKCIP